MNPAQRLEAMVAVQDRRLAQEKWDKEHPSRVPKLQALAWRELPASDRAAARKLPPVDYKEFRPHNVDLDVPRVWAWGWSNRGYEVSPSYTLMGSASRSYIDGAGFSHRPPPDSWRWQEIQHGAPGEPVLPPGNANQFLSRASWHGGGYDVNGFGLQTLETLDPSL